MKKTLAVLLSMALISLPFTGLMEFRITNVENPDTGYAWTYTATNENVLVLQDSIYEPDAYPEHSAGYRGGRTWVFRNGEDGDTVQKFAYAPLDGAKPLQYNIYLHRVENGLLRWRGDCYVNKQYVEIGLPENPSTGDKWQVDSDNADILTLQKDTYKEYITAEGFPDEGGVRRWQFVPEAPGDVAITFTNLWSRDSKGADTFVFAFRVDHDLGVTPIYP